VLLRQQLDDVRGQADAVHGKINAAVSDVNSVEVNYQELQNCLVAERNRTAHIVEAIAAKKSELAEASKKDSATEAQRRQLTAGLMLLEKTLEELRAAKRLEKQSFSLVPYKGRRGENRKPLYIECTAEGWILHPDRKTLEATPSTVADLHAELERRLKASASSAESSSYLFLLVRPDGITNYYRAQAAMQGLDVAFGYEFVDAAWVLDFSENSEKPIEPWMKAGTAAGSIAASPRKAAPPAPPILYPQGFEGASAGTPNGSRPGRSANSPSETGSAPAFKVTHGSAVPGLGTEVPGADPGRTVGQGPRGESIGVRADALGPPFRSGVPGGSLGTVDGMPESPSEGFGEVGIGPQGVGLAPPRATSGSGEATSFGHATSGSGTSQGTTARAGDPMATPMGNKALPVDPANPGNRTPAGLGDPASIRPGTASQGDPPQGSGRVPYPGEIADPSAKPPVKTDASRGDPNSASVRKEDRAHGGLNEPSLPRKPGSGNGGEEPGERATPGLDGPSFPRAPNRGNEPSGTTDKPKPFRLTGNRDWNIPIDCTSDGLGLPNGVKITSGALATADGGKTLVKAVQDLIARKQATVRDGEPPYRPQVRFLVHSEGLRVYHISYPILESLQVPILRQNVEPEDLNQSGPGGRQP
jgi:hypothetical protein